MWIKVLFIEYILWRILTTKSMFVVANMLKKLAVRDVPMNDYKHLSIQACSFDIFWNRGCTQSLVVSCKYWVGPLISTRVPGYSQVILLLYMLKWYQISNASFCLCIFIIFMYNILTIVQLLDNTKFAFLPEASFGFRVMLLPASVPQSVPPSVRHQLCLRDNSSPIQARITKFGP